MTSGTEGAAIGHNSALGDADRKALAGYVQEIETFAKEKQDAADQISSIYKDAKEHGFNTKAIREVVKQRKVEREEREAFENTVDTYKHALGMLSDLPLGRAAIVQAVEKATEQPKPKRNGKKDAKPPTADLPRADVSEQPFRPTLVEDASGNAPTNAEPMPEAPPLPPAA